MFQGFISKFTKNNLVKTAAAACIAASVAFGEPAQIESSNTYWELTGTAPNQTLTISGSGAMPNFSQGGAPWNSQRANITSVVIGESVTAIGDFAFYFCNLTAVTIPNSVTTFFFSRAFYECRKLTSITIGSGFNPSSLLESGSFNGIPNLEAINVDENNPKLASIDGVLFDKTKDTLKAYPIVKAGAYTIPASVKVIQSQALNARQQLTSLTIPASVTTIGTQALQNIPKLEAINVDENNPNFASIDGVLFDKTKATIMIYPIQKKGAFVIPNSVNSIGMGTFSGCKGLTSISIPNSVTSIGSQAFYSCSELTSVSIPASVTTIGQSAFRYCNKLEQIINRRATPQTIDAVNASTMFGDNPANTKLFVPAGAINAYKAATGWSTFSAKTFAIPFTLGDVEIAVDETLEEPTFDVAAAYGGAKAITWASDNPAVVIEDGKITAGAGNTVKITATLDDNYFRDIFVANVIKGTKAFVDHAPVSATYSPALKLGDLTLTGGYAWVNAATALSAGNNQSIAATYTDPSGNYNTATGNIVVNVAKAQLAIPTPSANLSYTGNAQTGIAANAHYDITNGTATNAGQHTATVELKDKANYTWADGTTANLTLTWTIAKAKITNPTPSANLSYTGNAQTGIAANAHYDITNGTATNAGQHTATVELKDKANYTWTDGTTANLTLTWIIVKADPTAPTGLTAKVGQKLENVSLAEHTGWSWMNTAELVGEAGEQTHKAKFAGDNNHNAKGNIDVKVAVSAAGAPIRDIQKSDGRVGIRLSKNVVSDKAEFEVILPSDKVLEVKAVIYDNTGNVVFEKTERGASVSWNLTNNAGRNVANGTYLIIVEAKGAKGTYAYSAKVGVKK